MGLLMSESMPLDHMLDDTAWMRERLSEWLYAADADDDVLKYEVMEIAG